ncbi:hypothetical protein F5X96DRAFT_614279 [Biscogniauxia mediterranea]|nr:hypothetical protein F5X96DRAFT_614279 [Biscogniauxia mediterranea]
MVRQIFSYWLVNDSLTAWPKPPSRAFVASGYWLTPENQTTIRWSRMLPFSPLCFIRHIYTKIERVQSIKKIIRKLSRSATWLTTAATGSSWPGAVYSSLIVCY